MLSRRMVSELTDFYIDNGMSLLPDFIIYNLDENEYKNFWQSIKNQRKGRLYTDGIDVYPVSWATSLFQSFKGWLGFENYCDPHKVELTLAKIAYHGYLKGFDSTPFQEHPTTTLPDDYKKLIRSPRSNRTSAELQQHLMTYYVTYSAYFPNTRDNSQNHSFGQIFLQEHLARLIPAIDIQNPQVIQDSIRALFNTLAPQDSFPLSSFSESYADYLVGANKFEEALQWSQEVKTTYKEIYIAFFINNRKYDSTAPQQAFESIAALFSDDPDKAVTYAKEYFSEYDRLTYLKAFPQLRQAVAKSYLKDAIKEKSSFVSTWITSRFMPLLSHAVNLDPSVLEENNSLQDILMKEEWIVYQFNDAIERKCFPEARVLYEKHPQFKFDKSKLNLLRNNYAEEVITKKNILDQALAKSDTDLAKTTANERIKLAEKVNKLAPGDKTLTTVTIDYAATLVRIDEIKHPKAKEADLVELNIAQYLIEPLLHLDNKNTYLRQILNQILLRKIACLKEKVQVPRIFNDDLNTRTTFVEAHKYELDHLQITLKKFIAMNDKNKDINFRPLLGKLHYLLGDILSFFFRDNNSAKPHFKKACEVMPENLYYKYRYSQIDKSGNLHELEDQFKEISNLHLTKYNLYMQQRWNDDQDPTPGIDIHGVPAKERGLLARFLG